MAERAEGPEAEAGEAASPSADAGVAAAALALAAARRRGARPDPALDAFLREQAELIRIQKEHLHEQRELVLSRLRWGRFSDRVKAALQVMTALVGLAVVAAIAVMAWQARAEHGLVIDAFQVPPDLARAGLTGQVAAARFLDKLQALQTATAVSDRPPQSYDNDWGADFKVDIPETGLTFSEFEKLLRDKLGHVDHVTGEVLSTPTGIAVTARLGDAPAETFTGAASDFDALAQKAAESVYHASQPYRFVEYLDQNGRVDEAFAVVADLAANGPPGERGWAYSKWAQMDLNDHGDAAAARLHAARGLGFTIGSDLNDRISLVNVAVWTGHEEANLSISKALDAEDQTRSPDTSQYFFEQNKLLGRAWLQFITPDYLGSAATWTKVADQHASTSGGARDAAMAATAYALDHDPAAARQAMASLPGPGVAGLLWDIAQGAFPALPAYWTAAVDTGDWSTALADARSVDAALEAGKAQRPIYGLMQQVWIWPLQALALARTQDLAGAQALIGKTPLDCYLCLRVRGQIAAAAGDRPASDRWFKEAVRQAPSSPFAYTEWGEALLAAGDTGAAIAQLTQAQAKAPQFADPIELTGEALLKKGDPNAAVAKFAEAARHAPRWGRDHLMWGEALARLGRTDEAKAQWRAAAGMALTAGERAELGRGVELSSKRGM